MWKALLGIAILSAGVLSSCGTRQPSGTPQNRQIFTVIEQFDAATQTIRFIPSQFFNGELAQKEAAKDGVTLTNPFYVRVGNNVETLRLADNATILLLGSDSEGNLVASAVPLAEFPGSLSAWSLTTYYWLDIQAGTITRVEAQYTP